MEFIFLGTSAGEQYPGFWCRCENCEKARQLGGKNIRKNSCAWISPETLIDFPAEIFMQAERYAVPVIDTEYLLFTHSHEDHFYPYYFGWRRRGARITELRPLQIYGNEQVCGGISELAGEDLSGLALEVNPIEPFNEYPVGPMQIVPLVANHPDGEGRGLNYIIHREGKTILYALDTDWFLPETYDAINSFTYDLVVIEGTFGLRAEATGHMNLAKVEQAYQLFQQDNLLKPEALFCVSHMSPHFTPIYDEIAPVMAEKGITIAYDGMKIEI